MRQFIHISAAVILASVLSSFVAAQENSLAVEEPSIASPPTVRQPDSATLVPLTAAEQGRFNLLESRPVYQLGGHHELSEYMQLRKRIMVGRLPDPAQDIAHYALMAMGQPYRRKAVKEDLGEADCVTFIERCIALACTDNWNAAFNLQNRLRFQDGVNTMANRNREPILDWIPSNAWLFDEVTNGLGVPVTEFEVVFEKRTQTTSYVSKDQLPRAYPQLRTGDIMLVIADQVDPPSDPVQRTRCAHIVIIYKPTESVQILHSYPPVASQWPLERLLKNPHVRGGKFLRLKPDARLLVATELSHRGMTTTTNPADLDSKLRLKKGQFGFVAASRAPDSTIDVDGIHYGVLQIRSDETLWSLFKGGWRGVAELKINQRFKQRHPTMDATGYRGDTIYYPISWTDGDKTPPVLDEGH